MKHAPRRHRTNPASGPSLLERITPNAAGIDCGSEEHYVAVPADRDAAPVRAFKTFTTELHRLAYWLTACGVTTVAMESTGVYWIPLYQILEARGPRRGARQRASRQERPGPEDRCAGLPVAPGAAQRRLAARQLPADRRHRGPARVSAPPRDPGAERGHARSADAEGPGSDEPPALHGDQRYHRRHRAAHRPRHPRGADRPPGPRAASGRPVSGPEADIRRRSPDITAPSICAQQNLELFDAYQRHLAACDAAIEAHFSTLAAKAPVPAGRCQARGRGKSPRR